MFNKCLLRSIVLIVAGLQLTACATNNAVNNESISESVAIIASNRKVIDPETVKAKDVTEEKDAEGNITVNAMLANDTTKSFSYDVLDLEPNYDDISALTIDIGDENSLEAGAENVVKFVDNDVELASGGIYVLKGSLDGQVRIKKGIGDRTLLVLDSININVMDKSAIYSDDTRLLIRLIDGSNNTISGESIEVANSNKFSAIYSKESISITGNGELNIDGKFSNAIESKDVLTILSGDINTTINGDGLKGKNGVLVRDGNIKIKSGDDGIKATDETNGSIFLQGGNITIKAKGKGISADKELIVAGGSVQVDSKKECMEALTVDLMGGVVNLIAGEDGINASDKKQDKKANQTGVYTSLSGTYLIIDSQMDAIDSNGDLYMSGGTVLISSSTDDNERIIDYNGSVRCSGGEMIGVGPSARMQDLGDNSNQNYIVVYYNEVMPAGLINVLDSANNSLLSLAADKEYRAALITSPKLEIGKKYTVVSSEDTKTIEITSVKTEIR